VGDVIDHVKLLIVMGNLLIGVVLAVHLFQAYRRYASPPLKPIFFHVVFLNLLMLLLLGSKYYDVNMGSDVMGIPDTLSGVLRNVLTYLFLIGFSYASLGAYFAFLGKKVSPTLRRWIGVATILLMAGIFAELFLAEGGMPARVHYHIYENIAGVFIALELGLVIALPIKAGRLPEGKWIKVVRAYSYLYISRVPVLAILLIVPQPFRLLLALLCLNAVPYLWYRLFMEPYIVSADSHPAEPIDLDGIALQYGLSPRESEILGLIMAGKSNRDMEEALFISYHTVKNHVYSIYRKLGVKTRFELHHLVSTALK